MSLDIPSLPLHNTKTLKERRTQLANLCMTTYQCEGDKEQLEELYSVLELLQNAKEPILDNRRGKLWFGCIVKQLGGNWEDVVCRGEVAYFDYDGESLCMEQDTDWCEQAGFRDFLEKRFPGIKIYYLEIEPCSAWGGTNDVEGKYFPDRYYMSVFDGYEFFCSLEEVAERVSKVVGVNVPPDFSLLSDILDEYTEEHEDDEVESYYNLYEIELVD